MIDRNKLLKGREIKVIDFGGYKRQFVVVDDLWISLEDIYDAGHQNINLIEDLEESKKKE